MTIREKLVYLCDTNNGWVDEVPAEEFADYLIENGVTIPAHGKWVFADDGYLRCSECMQKAPVVQPYDDEPTTTATNYCPNCGAIMDLED